MEEVRESQNARGTRIGGAISWRALSVLLVVLVAACGAAREASFAMAESSCNSDPARCAAQCAAQPPDREACDVLKVQKAEEFTQKGDARGVESGSLQTLGGDLDSLCRSGISRACKAADGFRPLLTKVTQADEAKKRIATDTADAAAGAQTDFQTRVVGVKEGAREVLRALGRDERSCTQRGTMDHCQSKAGRAAGVALTRAIEAESCGEKCPSMIAEAESALASAQAMMKSEQEEKREAEAKRTAISTASAAFKNATDSCIGDVPACQKECAADVGSYACEALAILYGVGDPRVTTSGANPEKARELAKKGCDAGNKHACAAQQEFDEKIATRDAARKAEPALPGLFARCSANRAVIERWRIAGVQAARSGDQAAAQRATQKIHEVEPQWNATLSELREAIRLVTGDEGQRFTQLVLQVKAQCSCEPTRSGACRR